MLVEHLLADLLSPAERVQTLHHEVGEVSLFQLSFASNIVNDLLMQRFNPLSLFIIHPLQNYAFLKLSTIEQEPLTRGLVKVFRLQRVKALLKDIQTPPKGGHFHY